MQADLVEAAAAPETLALPAVSTTISERPLAPARRSRHDDDEIGGLAVGDEGLLAVDDVGIARAGGGAHRLQIGAGAGLGHGDGADEFARAIFGSQRSFCSSEP